MSKTFVSAILVSAGTAMASTTVTKAPDMGDFWFPLSAFGTYVYSDSFVAPSGDTTVDRLGTWLNAQNSGGSSVRFEIWGDTGGNGPDASNVISSTGSMAAFNNSSLTYYEASASAGSLIPGQLYWFVATCVGESGSGFYNVGGHTQNSTYADNGTFWYSNDPAGIVFDGRGLTPEMAFSVTLVPAPAGLGVLGVAGLAAMRRRRA